MAYSIARFHARDFDKFKAVFEESNNSRLAPGYRKGTLYRSTSNPNELIIVTEWDDMAKARQWAQSSELKERLERGGGTERREVAFLENWGSAPGMTTQR